MATSKKTNTTKTNKKGGCTGPHCSAESNHKTTTSKTNKQIKATTTKKVRLHIGIIMVRKILPDSLLQVVQKLQYSAKNRESV